MMLGDGVNDAPAPKVPILAWQWATKEQKSQAAAALVITNDDPDKLIME